jgi:hypothetical protein
MLLIAAAGVFSAVGAEVVRRRTRPPVYKVKLTNVRCIFPPPGVVTSGAVTPDLLKVRRTLSRCDIELSDDFVPQRPRADRNP